MQIVTETISLAQLEKMSEKMFGKLVKVVVDLEKEIMVVDAIMHADQECFLLDEGSKQGDLWGINLYPSKYPQQDWIEFDSMINLRPGWGNSTRGVDDGAIQEKIRNFVGKKVIV